ncbi:ATP-grasp domain-containing protein [Streptomyces sp. NBC_00503]|uniref:ATP-grasp domain-containing protein n=1 Tax=Streptomyces sp. NBC_00503 TaxID=2903659 RepID=UPI002E7FCF24|nr:ATP-grasp domain-containing protein [Streptomyces sp. NBC_00503]WUD85076.1 ATP-grasp domain-containing protein [Streptomyces sp. NBC_00503]
MTLLLPPRLTASAARLRDAAHARGLATVRLDTFAVPEGLRAAHLHAGPRFADAVAAGLEIGLLEAPSDWLARLPRQLTGREIRLMTLREAYGLRRPVFVKSPNDKEIPALVYADGSRLPGPDAVDPRTEVLVSDVVRFTAEYRLFLLDGAVRTASRYAEDGRLSLGPVSADALAFAAGLPFSTLPSAIVVDVGFADGGGWSVIEANAAWASGTYDCDPGRALDVVLRAARPRSAMEPRDLEFLR